MTDLRELRSAFFALEGRCSIQLSYGQNMLGLYLEQSGKWSEYKDSNLGPPAPKAGALPGCATLRRNQHSTPTGLLQANPVRFGAWLPIFPAN